MGNTNMNDLVSGLLGGNIAKATAEISKTDKVDTSQGDTGSTQQPAPTATRPNGQVYTARRIAQGYDLPFIQRLREASPSFPVLLTGPPGTGKTSLAEAHAVNCGVSLFTVNGHADSVVDDLVGRWLPRPGGGYEWVTGPLLRAMQMGAVLFVDDITLMSPGVLARLYPVMDGRGNIIVEEHEGETVTAKPGFHLVAAHNPGVAGAILTEALASRFTVQIQVRTDYDLALALGVPKGIVRVAKAMDNQRMDGHTVWAPQFRELMDFRRLAEATDDRTAAANLLGAAPEEDHDVLLSLLAKQYTDISRLALS